MADRDIEQAADVAICDDESCPIITPLPHWHIPADRGDATQPDPAVIERAIAEIAKAISAKVGQFDLDGPKNPSINEVAAAAYEAAAAVLVPWMQEQMNNEEKP